MDRKHVRQYHIRRGGPRDDYSRAASVSNDIELLWWSSNVDRYHVSIIPVLIDQPDVLLGPFRQLLATFNCLDRCKLGISVSKLCPQTILDIFPMRHWVVRNRIVECTPLQWEGDHGRHPSDLLDDQR